jgi:hypothetical protein
MRIGMGQKFWYQGNHAQIEFITKCYSVIKWEMRCRGNLNIISVVIPTPNHPMEGITFHGVYLEKRKNATLHQGLHCTI